MKYLLIITLAIPLGCGSSDPSAETAGGSGGGGAGFGIGGGGAAGAAPRRDPDLRPPTFVKEWGELGTEPGQFVEPSSVELDIDGNVYVAGHEDRLQKFSRTGALLDIFGESGTGEGQFNHPHGLAMDRAAGLLYAGDQENGRVQVFTTEGAFVRLWSDPDFQHIHDVGIDPMSGEIYVGDFESDIMQKFNDMGDPVLEFGSSGSAEGQFEGAWGISTDSLGRVYVGDTGNQRVQVFTADGQFLSQWSGFSKPTGVFVDAEDRVYVCDAGSDEIVLFDVTGQRLVTWDLEAIVGSPSQPEDIIITDDGIHVYIADVQSHRVLYLMRQ